MENQFPLESNGLFRQEKMRHEQMRLRDLIFGLRDQDSPAYNLIARLDPDIADELHAVVAHRQMRMADFVADVLLEVALEAADAAWLNALMQRRAADEKGELEQLGDVLRIAMRRHLQAGTALEAEHRGRARMRAHSRIGNSYVPD